MKSIFIDTDPGVDDALAILLALQSNALKVEAITTVAGNVTVDLCTANALKVLELAGHPEVPVAQGAARPFMRDLRTAPHVHGSDGLAETHLPPAHLSALVTPAPIFLVERLMAACEPVTLLAIGPLTNVALALAVEPRIKEHVAELVIMGGAVFVPGNATAAAEFNFFVDPEAAHIVLHAGVPITLVGLDVTHKTRLTRTHIERMEASASPIAQFAGRLARYFLPREGSEETGVAIHDALAAAVAMDKTLVTTRRLYVDVETQGALTRGASVPDRRGRLGKTPNVDVCVDVDAERFLKVFLDTIQH